MIAFQYPSVRLFQGGGNCKSILSPRTPLPPIQWNMTTFVAPIIAPPNEPSVEMPLTFLFVFTPFGDVCVECRYGKTVNGSATWDEMLQNVFCFLQKIAPLLCPIIATK